MDYKMINNRVQFLEPEINREASDYISNNYTYIVNQVKKMGVHEDKAEDLVNDVFISIVESENDGLGYQSEIEESNIILVEQFVFGRLKGYSKNVKYRTDVVQANKSFGVIASSSSLSGEVDELDSFQKAYVLAECYDDLESIEDELSLRENIEYCITFDSELKLSMLALLKNVDSLNNLNINKTLFNPLKKLISTNKEFADALIDVLEFSKNNKLAFNRVLNSL